MDFTERDKEDLRKRVNAPGELKGVFKRALTSFCNCECKRGRNCFKLVEELPKKQLEVESRSAQFTGATNNHEHCVFENLSRFVLNKCFVACSYVDRIT